MVYGFVFFLCRFDLWHTQNDQFEVLDVSWKALYNVLLKRGFFVGVPSIRISGGIIRIVQGLEPYQLLAYDVAQHSDAPMDTGGEKPDLGDRWSALTIV